MSRFPLLFPAGGSSGPKIPIGWDLCKLAGIPLPGRVMLTKGEIAEKIDPQKKAGAATHRPVCHGPDPRPWGLRWLVWTQEQLDEADDICAQLLPPANRIVGKDGKVNLRPISLVHPQAGTLARVLGGITVLIQGATIWMPSSVVRGGREMQIEMLHWVVSLKPAAKHSAKPVDAPRNRIADQWAAKNGGTGTGTVLANTQPASDPGWSAPKWP